MASEAVYNATQSSGSFSNVIIVQPLSEYEYDHPDVLYDENQSSYSYVEHYSNITILSQVDPDQHQQHLKSTIHLAPPSSFPFETFLTILYSSTSLTSIVLNILTVIVLSRCHKPEPSKYLINLSMSDLLMSLFSIRKY